MSGQKNSRCYVKSVPSIPGSCWHDKAREFSDRLAEANANKQPCLACDTLDNDWPARRGLCLDCYCAVTNHLPQPPDGTTREDIFMRLSRSDMVTIALYFHKVERERHRLQRPKDKINVDVPRQAGYGQVERILNRIKEEL